MNRLLQGLLIFSLLIGLSWLGKSLILPIIFAFFLWAIINAWQNLFQKIPVLGLKIPRQFQAVTGLIAFIIISLAIGNLMANELMRFSEVYPTFEKNALTYVEKINDVAGIDLITLANQNLEKINAANIAGLAQSLAGKFSSAFGIISTILVYLLFMFSEQKYFKEKLRLTTGKKYHDILKIFQDILQSTQKYLTIKITLGALIALLSYGFMWAIGLEFPFVWAFLIFIFSFIPNFGPLLASIGPTVFALVNFDTWWQALVIFIFINLVQLFTTNFLEEKYLTQQLNLSPLLMIIALFFWEALWGLSGVFVGIPLTVIIMIILLQIPETRNIGIWMSKEKN